MDRQWYIHESLLLKLEAGRLEGQALLPQTLQNPDMFFGPVDVELEEPNMLLLDMAEYSFFSTGSPFQAEDELLRIDNRVRNLLGIPVRRKEVVQPYLLKEEEAKDHLTLRFTIPSEIEVTAPSSGIGRRSPYFDSFEW